MVSYLLFFFYVSRWRATGLFCSSSGVLVWGSGSFSPFQFCVPCGHWFLSSLLDGFYWIFGRLTTGTDIITTSLPLTRGIYATIVTLLCVVLSVVFTFAWIVVVVSVRTTFIWPMIRSLRSIFFFTGESRYILWRILGERIPLWT